MLEFEVFVGVLARTILELDCGCLRLVATNRLDLGDPPSNAFCAKLSSRHEHETRSGIDRVEGRLDCRFSDGFVSRGDLGERARRL